MKRSLPAIVRVWALAMGVLMLPALVAAQSTFTPKDETPEDFPDASGREDAFYACTACHGFKLVAAQGMFNALNWPDIPGLDDFAGTVFHASRWREDHDLTGRRGT